MDSVAHRIVHKLRYNEIRRDILVRRACSDGVRVPSPEFSPCPSRACLGNAIMFMLYIDLTWPKDYDYNVICIVLPSTEVGK
jgi:hypothetical protein